MGGNQRARTSTSPPRGLVVVAGLVGTILVVQLAASAVAAVSASRDSRDATHDVFSIVADITVERVERFASAAQDAVDETVVSLELANGADHPDEVAIGLYERINLKPQVGAIKVGYANGDLIELRRSSQGYVLEVLLAGPVRSVQSRTYDEDFNLTGVDPMPDVPAFDPASEPWYSVAAASGGSEWSDPYVRVTTRTSAVSATRAVRVDGVVIAVVAADLYLDELSTVLDGLPVGADGEAFVLDADTRIVAAPGPYFNEINLITSSTGEVPRASQVDLVVTTEPVAMGLSPVFGSDGVYMTLEQAFPAQPPWRLYLRATRAGLAPDMSGVQQTVLWTAALTALLMLTLALVIFRVWGPLTGMAHRASTDALTGLSNRHHFRTVGEAMLTSAVSSGESVVLIALDLDGFKTINDRLGHRAGDQALVVVADSLVNGTRSRDLVGRLGGDEFAVARRLTSRENARAFTERLRAEVAARLAEEAPKIRALGVTAGYAIGPAKGETLADMYERADDALIAGKTRGKGRTYPAKPGRRRDAPVGVEGERGSELR